MYTFIHLWPSFVVSLQADVYRILWSGVKFVTLGGVAKIKVAYNLVLLMGIPVVCVTCACNAPFGSDTQTKNWTCFYVYRCIALLCCAVSQVSDWTGSVYQDRRYTSMLFSQ